MMSIGDKIDLFENLMDLLSNQAVQVDGSDIPVEQLPFSIFDLPIGTATAPSVQPDFDMASLQAQRKEQGRCVHCGELRGMSAMGLLDCKVCTE